MILAGTIFGGIIALYLGFSFMQMARLGISFRQALTYAPLKAFYRIDDNGIKTARAAGAPTVYVIIHQSLFDPAIMLATLPEDTLHILDEKAAKATWLEPWRELARTMSFNAAHVFVSRRLVQILKRKGRIAVYLPDNVEPDIVAMRLYRAISRIALRGGARIVPIYVDGASLLPFSFSAKNKTRTHFFPRLKIGVLPPLTIEELTAQAGPAASTSTNALFDRAAEVRATTRHGGKTVFEAISEAAKRYGGSHKIVEDVLVGEMSYRKLLTAARAFGRYLDRTTGADETVGVLLPNANGVAVVLLGLMSSGRTAGMINYTAGPANVTSAVRTALIRTVISSRAFVEKAGIEDIVEATQTGGARIIWAEDVKAELTAFDKLNALVKWRSPVARQRPERPAAVIFTSGSEGVPKAVVLSHANLITNAMQVESRLTITPKDFFMNPLPVFHCFGLLGGLVLPLLIGVKTLLYPSPLHYKIIPQTVAKRRPTVLFSTDTFLRAYSKASSETDFASLRFIVTGAEALRAETRKIWRERFGVHILEGFGMTEASPVVAVNTMTHERDGSPGRLLPGMRVRLEPVEGISDAGRMWISGPNLMMGYMLSDQPGVVQPPVAGWHDSGDIVSLDKDGFITIRGRAKRFAKIAGEMVSLSAIENMMQALWPEHHHAAIALPDARRGERVVLLTTADSVDMHDLRLAGRMAGIAELAMPNDIIKIDEIPVLGTGKTDYATTTKIAMQHLGISAAAA